MTYYTQEAEVGSFIDSCFSFCHEPSQPFGLFRRLDTLCVLRPVTVTAMWQKHMPTTGKKAIPAPTSQPLPFCQHQRCSSQAWGQFREPDLRGEGKKKGNKDGQLTLSRAAMEGGVPAALQSQQHQREQDCSSQQQPAKMSSRSSRGAAAPERVAQPAGCGSKADLRVSGPRSTSSCSFALVMWLYHTDHRRLDQHGAANGSAGS